MSASIFQNAAELREFSRKQRVQAGRALMAGRKAYEAGLDGVRDNPYGDWKTLPEAQHSFQCLLWCRFLLGWLREHFRKVSAGTLIRDCASTSDHRSDGADTSGRA